MKKKLIPYNIFNNFSYIKQKKLYNFTNFKNFINSKKR